VTQLGPYELVREVGRGAVGVVHEARAPDGRTVALKVLSPPAQLKPEELESLRGRFLREARALAAVDHPNVVRVFDAGEAQGHLYLAMVFLDGENLLEALSARGALSPEEVVSVGEQLLAALDAIHHAGIIHRDVKPENLVVSGDGTVKLADFGVAWVEGEATLTRTGGVLGSPAYMSPEQILAKPVDRRSDLFSAAVTLYQLLANRLPFAGEGLVQMAHNVAYAEPAPLPSDVPYGLARVILRGLQKSPAARYTTATEFREALRPAVPRPASARKAPAVPSSVGIAAPTATVMDVASRCSRHAGRAAVGHCKACGRPVCRPCARRDDPPFLCMVPQPVVLIGLSPFGYAAFAR
jgi:serine/threonine-protein kinase